MINTMSFSKNQEADKIEKNLAKLIKYEMNKVKSNNFVREEGHEEKCELIKKAMLEFAAKQANIEVPEDKKGILKAFSNVAFETAFHSIIVEALPLVILGVRDNVLAQLADIRIVDAGDTASFHIKPKALPKLSRSAYDINVAPLETYAEESVTVTPVPYKVGVTLDLMRMLNGQYNIAEELARVARGIQYTQYKQVIDLLFNTVGLNGTPFYAANFSTAELVRLAEDVRMANGGSEVKAFGTLVALNKAGAVSTQNQGFVLQDSFVKEGYLGRAFGIDNIVLPQFTDGNLDFITDNMPKLRAIPDDKILILPVGDKMVKLAIENYFGVDIKDARNGSLRRPEYVYTTSFGSKIASAYNYGIIGVQ